MQSDKAAGRSPGVSPERARGREDSRDRLESLGPEALSDQELLALLLRTGLRRPDASGLAESLLAAEGGLAPLARLALPELARLPGLGPAKVSCLAAAFEIGRRIATRRLTRGDSIRGPADIHRHLYQRMRLLQREHFVALLVDGRHRVVRECVVSEGTLTASLVHPREVFRSAVREAAAAIVLAHNHPSGDPTPSEEDREVTRRLAEAGEILGIRVLDHVVIAEHGFHSFREAGELSRCPEPAVSGGLREWSRVLDAATNPQGGDRSSPSEHGALLRPQRTPVDECPGSPPLRRVQFGGFLRPGDGGQVMSKVSLELGEAGDPTLDRRRTQRTNLIVRVDYATVDELFSEFTRDINEGGLFIETEKPRPTGTEVAMHFNLPGSREVVRTVGRVVRVCSGDTDSPPGMGIEFDELTHEDRQKINSLIRALRIGAARD